jgi:drug/metabolite transporter (DMT)-like permease
MTTNEGLRLASSVLFAVTGIGLAPLFKKAALSSGADPLPLAVATAAVGALIASGYVLTRDGATNFTQLDRATWLRLAAVGALGSGAVSLMSILAMTQTTATNRSLFQSMYPVATALAARLLLAERLTIPGYAVMTAMVGGLFLMNTGSGGLEIGRSFWLLAATLPLIGLSDVAAKRSLSAANPRLVAAARLVLGALFLLLVLPWTSRGQWAALAEVAGYVAAAGTCLAGGLIFFYRAMDLTKASVVAAFVSLAPVATATAEWAWLGQSFAEMQLAGLVIVVGGAALLARQA